MKTERLGKNHLRVMHWNCTSIEQRRTVVEKVVYSADVVCLQETKLGESKLFEPLGFGAPIYNRNGHGQLIMVRSGIQYCELDVSRWNTDSLHLVAAELQNQPVRNIINVYACNCTMKEADWMALDEIQKSLPGETVFCGDFNARGESWGNTITNQQGEALEDALDHCDLMCVNDGSMTRMAMRPGDSDSAIDLAITTLGVSAICQWTTLGPHGNDHYPCTILLKRGRTRVLKRPPKVFVYESMEDDAINTVRKLTHSTKRSTTAAVTQPPWWNEELEVLWKEKRLALRKSQNNRDSEGLREAAKEATKNFKTTAKEAKSSKYEEFCNEVTADKALHKFWQLYGAMKNKRKSRTIPDFQKEDNIWVRSDEEKGRALFDRYLQQTDQDNELERRTLMNDLQVRFSGQLSAISLTPEDVKFYITHGKDTAPGPDGVRKSHLLQLDDGSISELARVYSTSLETSEIPTDWLDSHLAPVPKPEKDPSKIASYRIITMQNTVGKLPEKAVAHMLAAELEDKNVLPPTLGSYRRGKDTWMNAAVLASDVYDGFERGEETLVVALDLEDAYNRVQYDILMRTLVNIGITPALILWIGNAMLKRKVAMRIGTWASEACTITPGLPQGSALSPVLFNVYTVGITSNQLEGPGRTLTFADDGLVSRTGKCRQRIANSAQDELNRIGTWCDDNNGKMHPGKAGALWCSLNNHAVKAIMPDVTISGQVINRETSLRYLGLIFDRTLSGREHISRLVMKARKGLNVVKLMARDGMSQRILCLLFDMLVLSQVDYGFGLLTLSKTQLNRLDVIQNEGMRAILGCTKDTAAAAMRHVLGYCTMQERHKLAQVKAYLKVCADTKNPLHDKIGRVVNTRLKRGTEWMTQAVRTIESCGLTVEAIRRGQAWIRLADAVKDRFTQVIATLGRECREWPEAQTNAAIQCLIEDNCRPDEVIIYTDGSVLRGERSGWGFSAARHYITLKEGSGATNLTTSSMCVEIKAITEALKWLCSTEEHQYATILTDSMSTLEKIRGGSLYADWFATIQQSQMMRLQWIFCPGHAGVCGNERADKLAGSAAIEGGLTLDPPTVLSTVRDHLASSREEESFTKEMLVEKGVKFGEGRKSDLRGPARRLSNQLMMETVSMPTLRWTLLRREEELWSNPYADDANSGTK